MPPWTPGFSSLVRASSRPSVPCCGETAPTPARWCSRANRGSARPVCGSGASRWAARTAAQGARREGERGRGGLPFAGAHRPPRRRHRARSSRRSPRRSCTRSTWRSTAPTRRTDRGAAGDLARPALRAAGARGRRALLVAIDDVQWLDRARRMRSRTPPAGCSAEPVTFLLARRPGRRSAVENAVPRRAARARRRRGHQPGRDTAHPRRPARASGCRTTCSGGCTTRPWATRCSPWRSAGCWPAATSTPSARTCPCPTTWRTCSACASPTWTTPVRRVLLALALDADLRVGQLQRPRRPGGSGRRGRGGRRPVDGERVRASHPLLAAAAKRHATAATISAGLHRALAEVVANEQRRALHLALATTMRDEELAAARVAAAAARRQREARPAWRSSWAPTPGG